MELAQKRPLVVGFAGVAGAGKTTVRNAVAKVLSNKVAGRNLGTGRIYRYAPQSASFAGPIREGLERFGVTKAGKPGAYRELAQYVGNFLRDMDPDHWVDLFKRRYLESTADWGTVILLDDVRYSNEIHICDIVYFVVPQGRRPKILTKEQRAHASEAFAENVMAMMDRGEDPFESENPHTNPDWEPPAIVRFDNPPTEHPDLRELVGPAVARIEELLQPRLPEGVTPESQIPKLF